MSENGEHEKAPAISAAAERQRLTPRQWLRIGVGAGVLCVAGFAAWAGYEVFKGKPRSLDGPSQALSQKGFDLTTANAVKADAKQGTKPATSALIIEHSKLSQSGVIAVSPDSKYANCLVWEVSNAYSTNPQQPVGIAFEGEVENKLTKDTMPDMQSPSLSFATGTEYSTYVDNLVKKHPKGC